MKQRIITTFLILLVVVPPLLLGGVLLELLKLLIMVFGGYEIMHLSKHKKPTWLIVLLIVGIVGIYYIPSEFAFAAMAAYFLIVMALPVFLKEFTSEDSFLALAYMILMRVLIVAFGTIQAVSLSMVWFIIICNFSSDIFAYFVGMKFGKHKLIPRVSPKKTVEGALGGWFFGALIGFAFAYFNIASIELVHLAIMAICIPVVSQIGDLAFSSVKRHYEIKDFGTLLPGHGGVLDRIDSMIFSFIFIYILLVVF